MLKGMHQCSNSSGKFRLYEAWKISRREGARGSKWARGREGEITEELSRLLSPTFFITALPLPPFWLFAYTPSLLESLPSCPSFIFVSFHGLQWVFEQRNRDTTAWMRVKVVYSTAQSDSVRGDKGPRTNPFSSVTGREQPQPKAFLLWG